MQIYEHRPDYQVALKICQKLIEEGYLAYFAGGCVRDFLLDRQPSDFDVTTSARPDQVVALFSKTVETGRQFGVIMVIEEGIAIEVATFRSDGQYVDGRRPEQVFFSNPYEDSARRDFTVNSLFWNPVDGQIIDHHGGIADLQAKILRTVGDPEARFREDHLRILRLFRFQSQLRFDVEPDTLKTAEQLFDLVRSVAKERLVEEIEKLGMGSGANEVFSVIWELGLFVQNDQNLSKEVKGQWPADQSEQVWANICWSFVENFRWSKENLFIWLSGWPISKVKVQYVEDFLFYFFNPIQDFSTDLDLEFFERIYRSGGWRGILVFLFPQMSSENKKQLERFKQRFSNLPESPFKFNELRQVLSEQYSNDFSPQQVGKLLKRAHLWYLWILLTLEGQQVDSSAVRRIVLMRILKESESLCQ